MHTDEAIRHVGGGLEIFRFFFSVILKRANCFLQNGKVYILFFVTSANQTNKKMVLDKIRMTLLPDDEKDIKQTIF